MAPRCSAASPTKTPYDSREEPVEMERDNFLQLAFDDWHLQA